MKGSKKAIVTVLIVCLTLLSANFACAPQSNVDDAARNFDVTILDENGNAVEGAELFLYSFLDGMVVASEKADADGKAQIRYFPDLDDSQPSRFVYGDYIIYAVKDGYAKPEYSMTKIYCNADYCTEDEIDSSRSVNMEKHAIKLEKEKMTAEMTDMVKVSKEELAKQDIMGKVRKELIAERKLSKEKPIHVLTEEDYRIFEEKGIVTAAELKSINMDASQKSILASSSLKNKVTPIIKVHATKAAKVTVKLNTSDGVKVEVGVKASGASGGYSISGSRTRTMESTITTFPQYTTTKSGACKVFNTRANYTTWQTSSYYGGNIQDHIGISSLNGGMALDNNGKPSYDTETTCSTYNKTFASAGSYDNKVDIGNNSTYELKQIRKNTIDLGLNVSFAALKANLGVSTVTGTATSIKYTPKSNYSLRLYSSNEKTWHCAQKAL